MNVISNMQQSNFTPQLQSSSSVQSQSSMSGFPPQMSGNSNMDSVQFSDMAQMLSQNYNNSEVGEKKENDGDGDDRGVKMRQSAQSQANNSQAINNSIQANNIQVKNDFQSALMKNILSAYGVTSSLG